MLIALLVGLYAHLDGSVAHDLGPRFFVGRGANYSNNSVVVSRLQKDASSALLVMQSLKRLVTVEGVTVVSVIHQPRKFIFDLFDSLILLGVGGNMVYHGPTDSTLEYFSSLRYTLPPGESVADWLIDISTGRLEPDSRVVREEGGTGQPRQFKDVVKKVAIFQKLMAGEDDEDQAQGDTEGVEMVKEPSIKIVNPGGEKEDEEEGSPKKGISFAPDTKTAPAAALSDSVSSIDDDLGAGGVGDGHAVCSNGVTVGKVAQANEEAKARRAWLYQKWNSHFSKLDEKERNIYTVPKQTPLPSAGAKPPFIRQFFYQVSRAFLVSRQ